MDDAMMQRALATYGAANTPANIAQLSKFMASNPQAMEHRAMGMRGSINDDNTDLLGPLLEKLVAASAGRSGAAVDTEPPPVANGNGASAPQARAPAPRLNDQNREATGRPLQPGGIPGDYNAPGTPPQSGGSGLDWLKDILLTLVPGATAGGAAAAGARPPRALPRSINEDGSPARMSLPSDPEAQRRLAGPPEQKLLEGPRAQLEGPPNKQLQQSHRSQYPSGAPVLDDVHDSSRPTDPYYTAPAEPNGPPSATQAAQEKALRQQKSTEALAKAARNVRRK